MLIGFFDRTVILTYLSLISGTAGSIIAVVGPWGGQPYLAGFFLVLCGVCDAFDGIVARSKKNRTDQEKIFGGQIDSLSDLVAFGVQPVCISVGLFTSYDIEVIPHLLADKTLAFYAIVTLLIQIFYVVCAITRLAYFNLLEEERRREGSEGGVKEYLGLPVTPSAAVFPIILLLGFFTGIRILPIYIVALLAMGFLFIGRFKLKKPDNKILIPGIIVGVLLAALLLVIAFLRA